MYADERRCKIESTNALVHDEGLHGDVPLAREQLQCDVHEWVK